MENKENHKCISDIINKSFTFEDMEKAFVAGMDRGVEICLNQQNKDKPTNNTYSFIQFIQKYLK